MKKKLQFTPDLSLCRIIGWFLCFYALFSADFRVWAQDDGVPNSGSPYLNLGELDENSILHLPTGVRLDSSQLIEAISGARVIYVGETHDNLEAHRVQLEIIRRLAEKNPGKLAVGMEMFRRSAQPGLNLWNSGALAKNEFKKLFHDNWGHGYSLYRPIFDFCQQNAIPLIGLKSSKDTEARLRQEGLEATGLPELDLNDPYHRAYAMSVFGGHAEKTEKPYQMLLLWEESMAETVAEFLRNEDYKDWKLVVLAGGFHVQYGFGIPKRAFRRVPHSYSIVLPTVTHVPDELKDREMNVEHVPIPLYAADFAWKVSYKVLPENQIRLGVMLKEDTGGLRVTGVGENSNAERAGILKDDLLLKLDGEPIGDVDDFVERLQKNKFGDTLSLHIRRGEGEQDLNVLLQEPEKN